MCFRSYLSQPAMSVNRILEQLGAGSKVVGYFVLMVLVMLTLNLMRLFSRLFRAETQQIQNSSEDYSVENSEFESATENSELSVNSPDITSLDLRPLWILELDLKIEGHCGHRSADISNFNRHLATHTRERRHRCPIPNYPQTFIQSSHVRRHLRTFHIQNWFCRKGCWMGLVTFINIIIVASVRLISTI